MASETSSSSASASLSSSSCLARLPKHELLLLLSHLAVPKPPSRATKQELVPLLALVCALHRLSVAALKDVCRHHALSVVGKRAVLVARVVESLAKASSFAALWSALSADDVSLLSNACADKPPSSESDSERRTRLLNYYSSSTAEFGRICDRAAKMCAKQPVSVDRLVHLTAEELRQLCRAEELDDKGQRKTLARRLAESSLKLDQLTTSQLRLICATEGRNAPNERAALFRLLNSPLPDVAAQPPSVTASTAAHAANSTTSSTVVVSPSSASSASSSSPLPSTPPSPHAPTTQSPSKSTATTPSAPATTSTVANPPSSEAAANKISQERRRRHKTEAARLTGPMTRAAYRKQLRELGLVEDDQDVYHIIARENKGADHADNFDVARCAAFNRSIGKNYDHLNCYLAGLQKAEKAVRVSREFCGYDGPSAHELYHQGLTFWHSIRVQEQTEKRSPTKTDHASALAATATSDTSPTTAGTALSSASSPQSSTAKKTKTPTRQARSNDDSPAKATNAPTAASSATSPSR